MKHEYTGIKRIFSAFKNSFDGFVYAFCEEEAFRQDLMVAVVLFVVAWLLPVLVVERVLLCSSIFFVLFAELTNSAIEACIDRISPDWHKLSKAAKDIGSLIVLLSFVNLIFVWIMICKKFF